MDGVLLTVTGDACSIEVQASPTVPLVTLVAGWAAQCSTHPAAELAVLSTDLDTLLDPAATLGALGIGAGSSVRLVTGDEATSLLDGSAHPGAPILHSSDGRTATVQPSPPNPLPVRPPPDPPDRPRPEGLIVRPGERREIPGSLGVPAPPTGPLDLDRLAPPGGARYAAVPPPHSVTPATLPETPATLPETPARPETPIMPAARPVSPVTPATLPETPIMPAPLPERPIMPVQPVASTWPPSAPSTVPPSLRPPALDTRPTGSTDTGSSQDEPALPDKVPARRRLARALKAGLSRNAAPPTRPGEFAKVAAPKAGERYRLAMQETDRIHNLDMMIRGASLRRCAVIAVVSPKGGAGKTTLTALLGMLFAELRRDPVLALDANPDFGNLRDKLSYPGSEIASTDNLAEWLAARPNATPAELASLLGAGPHGLRYLPTPTGSIERMVKAADFDLYRDLIARLRDYEGIILVDCGTGLLDPPVRAALGTADQIVLITDSSADTARLVVTAAQYLPADTPTWLVANKMPDKGAMVDLAQVASAIPQLRGVTVVPEQRLSENIVTPTFDWSTAPEAWREPVREIAARLADNWKAMR